MPAKNATENVYVHHADTEEEALAFLRRDRPDAKVLFIERLKPGKWHAQIEPRAPKKWDAQRPDGYRFGQLGYTENPLLKHTTTSHGKAMARLQVAEKKWLAAPYVRGGRWEDQSEAYKTAAAEYDAACDNYRAVTGKPLKTMASSSVRFRKNPVTVTVTATAAQVFEKARQSGYPTEGFTAQQLVDAMWPNGEVRLSGTGAKVVRRGRTHSALQERKMVGNPRDSKARSYPHPAGGVVASKTKALRLWEDAFLKGGRTTSRSEARRMASELLHGEQVYDACEVNPRGSKTTRRSQATHSRLLTRGKKVSKAAVGEVYYTKTGQPYVKDAAGRPRFISRDEATAHVTHEDLVDAGLRWNPGLVWHSSHGALVALGKGNKVRYTIDENYGHKDTGYHYVLHVAPTLGGRGTSYAAKTIDHAKEMAEASEDPSLRWNPRKGVEARLAKERAWGDSLGLKHTSYSTETPPSSLAKRGATEVRFCVYGSGRMKVFAKTTLMSPTYGDLAKWGDAQVGKSKDYHTFFEGFEPGSGFITVAYGS